MKSSPKKQNVPSSSQGEGSSRIEELPEEERHKEVERFAAGWTETEGEKEGCEEDRPIGKDSSQSDAFADVSPPPGDEER